MTTTDEPLKKFEEVVEIVVHGLATKLDEYMRADGRTFIVHEAVNDLATALRQAAISYGDERVREALEEIEQSIKQHTVPEARDLITRSYVRNTLAALQPKPE